MNRFEQEYIKIINEWNSNLLLEANLKSLIPNIQQQLIGNKSYNDLTDNEKQQLQNNINKQLNDIEQQVNNITDNKQYQSWIYNVLKNKEVDLNDLNPLKSLILDFEKLSKRPDIKSNQKNIQNYSTLNDLHEFIDSFKEKHNLSENIYKNLKKIYSNDEFTVYFINKNQYEECNILFGTQGYFSTGWCIAKNEEHFNEYLTINKDKYNGYFVFIKDNKPYALLHYGSYQFKDDSNKKLEINNPNILDCLLYINDNINDYYKDDLLYYGKQLFLKEHPNPIKEELIAFEIGGEYNKETKTIDCKGKQVKFKNEWLDEHGTFDFTFINTSKDLSYMFYNCKNLIKLPNNFAIPNNVVSCYNMFLNCLNLTKLPNSFNIPNNVKQCCGMFYKCENLIKLPDTFKIPNNVEDCSDMFYGCNNLTKLPNDFTIPNNIVIDCRHMFEGCKSLTKLPNNFSIPKYCKYYKIFSDSGLEDKYNIEDLLK